MRKIEEAIEREIQSLPEEEKRRIYGNETIRKWVKHIEEKKVEEDIRAVGVLYRDEIITLKEEQDLMTRILSKGGQ